FTRRADPGAAVLDLRLERFLGDALDHLLIVRIVLRCQAGHPVGGGVDDRSQIDVEGLARLPRPSRASPRRTYETPASPDPDQDAPPLSRHRDRPSRAPPFASRPTVYPS